MYVNIVNQLGLVLLTVYNPSSREEKARVQGKTLEEDFFLPPQQLIGFVIHLPAIGSWIFISYTGLSSLTPLLFLFRLLQINPLEAPSLGSCTVWKDGPQGFLDANYHKELAV